MNRRDFLTTMLAACAAPAIVRADSLMRIVPNETWIAGLPPPFTRAAFLFASGVGHWPSIESAIYIPTMMEMSDIDKEYRGEKTLRPKITMNYDYISAGHSQPKVVSSGIIGPLGELGTLFGDPKRVVAWRRI